jgi:uncharacterized protein YprB with RNaseH-like and TPR domain
MRVMFFDIEATGLIALMGRVLCASYCELGKEDAWTDRLDETKKTSEIDDSSLVVKIRDTIEEADILCTWNGILFDVPFLNARLQLAGERPCQIGEKYGTYHLDLMYYATGQALRIGSKKLDNVAKFFKVTSQKTELDWDVWQLAATGNREAMDTVVEHCEADVQVVRDLWPYLLPHVKKITLPISSWYQFVEQIPNGRS